MVKIGLHLVFELRAKDGTMLLNCFARYKGEIVIPIDFFYLLFNDFLLFILSENLVVFFDEVQVDFNLLLGGNLLFLGFHLFNLGDELFLLFLPILRLKTLELLIFSDLLEVLLNQFLI